MDSWIGHRIVQFLHSIDLPFFFVAGKIFFGSLLRMRPADEQFVNRNLNDAAGGDTYHTGYCCEIGKDENEGHFQMLIISLRGNHQDLESLSLAGSARAAASG